MHIVIQMINNPDREENHDENDRGGGNKHTYIPEGAFFTPNINEKDKLDKGLKKS